MDVYLVPVGPDAYECYYEAPEDEPTEAPADQAGFIARWRARFQQQLKEAEQARHEPAVEAPTFLGRMQNRSLRWIAERIAEQRLLWHLRKAGDATLHMPADLAADRAEAIMRAGLKRDADRHRNRLIIHSVALLLAIPVAVLPGPNVLGYLFMFTVTGHYLSWRGAVRGLHEIRWAIVPDAVLGELRRAFSLRGDARHRLILDVAHRLHMPKMARFVEQMTAPTA